MTPCLERQPVSLMQWCRRLALLWLSSAGYALPFCAPAESAFEIPLVPCSTSLCPSVFFPTPYSSPSLSAPSCFPKTTLQYDGGKISNNNSVVAVVLLLSRIRLLATPSVQFSSVQFSSVVQLCPTLCNPNGLWHARLLCPSLFPSICSHSSPLSQ